MTSVLQAGNVRSPRDTEAPSRAVKSRKAGAVRRILDSLSVWDRKQKEREIGCLLARSGGRFTDELERRIMQREMTSDWGVHW